MPVVESSEDGAESVGRSGSQVNGIEPNGIQPNGIQPNGIEPNGLQFNGPGSAFEPNGSGARTQEDGESWAAAGTGTRLRALRINGVRLEAGPAGLRIDAIVVNGLKLEASGGLVIEEVEVAAPKPMTTTSIVAPAPDLGAVSVSSIELPDGRRFDS